MIDKNIPAFPKTPFVELGTPQNGMTLRDYFAAKAMMGILTDPEVVMGATEIAELSYKYADAMLEARND